MILSCNSCEKKFVVPDQAITSAGRMVQCGSCGNKWRQFPIKIKETLYERKNNTKKTSIVTKIPKPKKKRIKKPREVDLYSAEYLEKKHGIKLDDNKNKILSSDKKVSFGFYNSIILFTVIIIVVSKSLHFFQDFIILSLPFSEFYLNYFFETIRNMFEILKNLISSY